VSHKINVRSQGFTPPDLKDIKEVDLNSDEKEILETLTRVTTAEKTIYEQWQAAVDEKRPIGQQSTLQKNLLEAAKRRMEIEKILPEVLAAKGKYKDIEEVGNQIARIGVTLKADMSNVAAKCSGEMIGLLGSVGDREECEVIIHRHIMSALEKCTESLAKI